MVRRARLNARIAFCARCRSPSSHTKFLVFFHILCRDGSEICDVKSSVHDLHGHARAVPVAQGYVLEAQSKKMWDHLSQSKRFSTAVC